MCREGIPELLKAVSSQEDGTALLLSQPHRADTRACGLFRRGLHGALSALLCPRPSSPPPLGAAEGNRAIIGEGVNDGNWTEGFLKSMSNPGFRNTPGNGWARSVWGEVGHSYPCSSPPTSTKRDLGSRRCCLSFVAVSKGIRTRGTRGWVYSLTVELVSQVFTHVQAHWVARIQDGPCFVSAVPSEVLQQGLSSPADGAQQLNQEVEVRTSQGTGPG